MSLRLVGIHGEFKTIHLKKVTPHTPPPKMRRAKKGEKCENPVKY